MAELLEFRHRQMVLDEIRHVEVGCGGEILHRQIGLAFREMFLASVEQRFR